MYRCRKIGEAGSQQLLLDTQAIKGLLLDLPAAGIPSLYFPSAPPPLAPPPPQRSCNSPHIALHVPILPLSLLYLCYTPRASIGMLCFTGTLPCIINIACHDQMRGPHLASQHELFMAMQFTVQSSKCSVWSCILPFKSAKVECGHAVCLSSQQKLSTVMDFTFQVN